MYGTINGVEINGVEGGGADQTGVASGFLATNFGAVTAKEFFLVESMGTVPRFGTPNRVFDQTVVMEGSTVAWVGRPFALQVAPNTQVAGVASTRPTVFGLPSAPQNVTVQATGYRLTNYGAHRAWSVREVTRFGVAHATLQTAAASLGNVAQFGQPGALGVYLPSGFSALRLGQPTVTGANLVPAGIHSTRFGRPKASITGTYRAYRFNAPPARFGLPRASVFVGDAVQPAGFGATFLGQPSASNGVRAFQFGPAARFGTPIIERGIQC